MGILFPPLPCIRGRDSAGSRRLRMFLFALHGPAPVRLPFGRRNAIHRLAIIIATADHGPLQRRNHLCHGPAMRHALDGWIDVCRTGTWTDMHGREAEMTPATPRDPPACRRRARSFPPLIAIVHRRRDGGAPGRAGSVPGAAGPAERAGGGRGGERGKGGTGRPDDPNCFAAVLILGLFQIFRVMAALFWVTALF